MTSDITMWHYWKDEYFSLRLAIEGQYRDLLTSDPIIAQAVAQIRVGEMAIEARMEELLRQHEENEE